MAITYPLVLPASPGFQEFAWHPDSAVSVQRNEFTPHTRVYAWPSQSRRASVKVGAIKNIVQAKEWQAFFLKLNGVEGTFLMQDPAHASAPDVIEALAGSFAAKVDGGNQVGNLLQTKDWPVSIAGLLRKGDYIGLNARLYSLLEDVSSDSSGNATLSIWPHAAADIADLTGIWVGSEAYGKFRLTEFPDFVYSIERMMDDGISFTCEEAVE